jgi:SAM-dependent methyltransferase
MEFKHTLSTHYLETEGEEYFRWQRKSGEVGGIINARKFKKYIREDDSVLDFGCGGGYLLKNLSCGRRIGVEINPAARQVAKQNGVECYSGLSEVQCGLVDVVISNHALEHVPAPVEVFAELNRLMKPSGLLVLLLPIDDWRTQRRINPSDINHHLYTWTPQLLFNCLREAGFDKDCIRIKIYTHAWFPGFEAAFRFVPGFIFDAGCRAFAILKKRRQLFAIALKCSHLATSK